MQNRQTKIICTLSNNRCDREFIEKMIAAGMNVVRMNTAHMDIAAAEKMVQAIRGVSDRVGILLDTKGPEVRTCNMPETLQVTTGDVIGVSGTHTPPGGFQVSYDELAKHVPAGSCLLVDDGALELRVGASDGATLQCTVLNDGEIKNKKSVNIPGVKLYLPALTERDAQFIDWATHNGEIDFIAHSFVRNRDDVEAVQAILDLRNSPIQIIAKIENHEGVKNLESILDVAYGVMVARGDLGIELPAAEVPGVQKEMIQTCIRRRKPVITATQMLHTMIENPRPTRAEVSDVANAIYDGTDAVMLSGETAIGNFPLEAVHMMAEIAVAVEKTKETLVDSLPVFDQGEYHRTRNHIAKSAVECAAYLPVKAIITSTKTGVTARLCSAYRGRKPILALSEDAHTIRRLSLSYGVYATYVKVPATMDALVQVSLQKLLDEKKIGLQDLIVFMGGGQIYSCHTNFMQIDTPEVLLSEIEFDKTENRQRTF
ncbi:MAG: pyruvate kinase [Kiritimatiellales bacterium]